MADLSKQYRKHTHREHILELPDTYIGSIENTSEDAYVCEGDAFVSTTLTHFNPGFYKLIDELLVNAHDQVVRLRQRVSDNPVKKIDVEVSDDKRVLTIRNDGEGIDVEKHPEYGVYIPQLIFGELLTSTNYDKDEKKLVGGKNGYGVKLVNIFAQKLQVTIVDSKRELKYVQVFEHNMSKVHPPKVTKCKTKSYVEIEWTPDFKRFGWDCIPSDVLALVQRRVNDLAMTVGKGVRVTWCKTLVRFHNLVEYAAAYVGKATPTLTYGGSDAFELAVADSPLDRMMSVAFVNGIWTKAGKHIDDVTSQIVSHTLMFLETKKKLKVKPSLVRESLAVFLVCSVENPSFSSQTKEVMTTKTNFKIPEEFLKKIVQKLGLVDKIMAQQSIKDGKENTKTDGKKSSRITGIPKLDDAMYAGTSKSHECTLILTEGDSAKSMALSGLTQEQRKYYGVFPLRGKLLNVKDTSVRKVEQTEEIAHMKKIVGLESGKKYTDVKSLRYGRILVMTDQDYDGSHIRGLIINMFHELWHTLLEVPGFLAYMATPIVKATRGTVVKSFYTQYEYEQWKDGTQAKGWKVKYYKGLGTSTRDEAKEYFQRLNVMPYSYTGPVSDNSIDLAFNKAKADDRKVWLKTYEKARIAKPTTSLPYEEFVNDDLIHFSNYNLERSIPSVMDGLKTSQRKILYSAFKRNLKTEIRVAQFAGYVSEHSGYHHGEQSLNDTIVGMAQDFVGSNNIPWFVPQGQFGTRLKGGTDAASARYIHTHLQPYVSKLVPSDDFAVAEYRDDDGLQVEPEWYAPILPMLLINGCRGIGTGYSTFVPQYNPADLKRMLLKWLDTGSGLDDALVPWVKGFGGKIVMEDAQSCVLEGTCVVEKDGVLITDLPVGTWTADVRETLDKMATDSVIKDYTDTSTDMVVNIRVRGPVAALDKVMKTKWKLTNMHAFNAKGVIQKYATPNEVLKEYADVRLDLYGKRREHMLKELKSTLPYHENVVRFIRQQSQDVPIPDLRRKTTEVCVELLEREKFVKIDGGYDYLMKLPIASLTLTHAKKHEDELASLKSRINELETMTPKGMWKTELQSLAV